MFTGLPLEVTMGCVWTVATGTAGRARPGSKRLHNRPAFGENLEYLSLLPGQARLNAFMANGSYRDGSNLVA